MTVSRGIRRRLAWAERREVWTRWRAGEPLEAITRALAVAPSHVDAEIRRLGGIAPRVGEPSGWRLTAAERQLLVQWRVGHPDGISRREAARRLGRAPSTISRELRRNGGRVAHARGYDAAVAEARAWRRARRRQPSRLAQEPALCAVVAAKLQGNWSPAQISRWLRLTYPTNPAMQLSPETIYRSLYVQARGALKRELTAHLRQGHTRRQPRARRQLPRPGVIVDGASIATRPPEADTRAVPGHWEGDLLMGNLTSCIITLVERASRYVTLVRVPSKATVPVVDALIGAVQRLPQGLVRSLTWDRGSELAQHRRFTVATDVQVYFCDPRSPWQRGSNENTNGLLRQYFPKGRDVSGYTQEQLDAIADQLNTRPRQTLGWATPADALSRLMRGVALTG